MRGKICQQLGLRKAPELRFYRDNTGELMDAERERAREYFKEIEKEKEEKPLHRMQMALRKIDAIQNMSSIQFDEIMQQAQEASPDVALMLQDVRDNGEEVQRSVAQFK